jgi:outer membrane protein W
MLLGNYIRIIALSVATALLLPNMTAFAQSYDRSKLTKIDHKVTIGFERAVYTLYMPHEVQLDKKTKRAEDKTNRIILRMKLTSRFRLETGLSYKAIDKILRNNGRYNHGFNIKKPCKLSVPLTIQYQLQNDRKRLRPYFGAGVQYFRQDIPTAGDNSDYQLYNNGISNNLKYINIIFTQGLIYDITPDLQITQSIHILPEYGIRPIGINIGVGYRIK